MTSRFDWRHQYDAKRDKQEGDLAAITCREESLTQQHFAEDADLNVIAKRFGLDKQPMPTAPIDPAAYGDFSIVPDLRTLLDIARDAKNKFMELPAKMRTRFHNDPSELWDFVSDPDNADESVRLGLLKRPEPPKTEGTDTPPPTPEQTPKAS